MYLLLAYLMYLPHVLTTNLPHVINSCFTTELPHVLATDLPHVLTSCTYH